MSGRWASSNRRAQLPTDWNRRKAAVKRRSGGRCEVIDNGQRCPRPSRDVHHGNGPHDHRIESLVDICGPHHDEQTQREAQAAKPRRTRPAEPHPGRL